MIRIAIYKKIEEIIDDFEYYEALALRNQISFNEEIEEDYCGALRKIKKREKLEAAKNVIDKIVLKYGIDGALSVLKRLSSYVVPKPPWNNLLSAVIRELTCEVETLYSEVIQLKLPKLIDLIEHDPIDEEAMIQLINKVEDPSYILGLDPKEESLDQISLWEVPSVTPPSPKKESIDLMGTRRLNLKSFLSQYILYSKGWEEFKTSVYYLIDLACEYQAAGRISNNFIPTLIKECNRLIEENESMKKQRKMKAFQENSMNS